MTDAPAAPVPPPAADAMSQVEVGWLFVQHYYTYLNKDPMRLHQFYTRRSIMCHGNEGEHVEPLVGQAQINRKIVELGLHDCKVLVSNVDSQPSISGLVVQVLGEMSNRGGPSQKFVQTFFLAEQKTGYFVLNDIFRFLKEDVPESDADIDEEIDYVPAAPAPPVTVVAPTTSSLPSSRNDTPGPESVELDEATIQEQYAATAATMPPDAPPLLIEEDERPAVPVPAEQSQVDEVPPVPLSPLPAPAEVVVAPVVAAPVAAPVVPVVPAAPAGRVSWAALAAKSTAAAAAAAASTTTAAVPAAAPTQAPPALIPAPAVPAAQENAKPASKDDAPAAQPQAAQPQQQQRRPRIEFHSAYIKGVNEKVPEAALREALTRFGKLTHFEVSRPKSCAFVDFADAVMLKSALEAHTLPVGDQVVYIEERRRGNPGGFGNNAANRGNGSGPAKAQNGGFRQWNNDRQANGTNGANGATAQTTGGNYNNASGESKNANRSMRPNVGASGGKRPNSKQ
ncbi:uncharacterized protein V1518DRAFT_414293 [Limtongia smithiae]|uniref:uncharacterized protein n=1 Tax=Limtongia smithiae TaxID=1125753 RepID=UPI0034CD8D48